MTKNIYIYIYRSSRKVPVILVRFNENLIFSKDFRENLKYQNLVKIRPLRAEFFHADGRTDGRNGGHNEASIRFSQFCERT